MFFDRYEMLCKELKKTATGVATELNIGRATVNYWRKGNTPKQEILNKIANYFDVSIDYLLENTTQKKPLINGDEEITDYLNELKNRSEMRMLFSISKGCTKKEIEQAVRIIEALRKDDNESD